jgi:hypothetical protein
VSEQESRVLVTQWCEQRGVFFSVETPTGETYRQSGTRELSARTDVTAYGRGGVTDRALHIELKAGNPGVEEFRKDLEKLLRERVKGLWFHTLTTANSRTWSSLERKVSSALDSLHGSRGDVSHSVHFAFCVLESRQLRQFDLNFGANWHDQLDSGFKQATSELPSA